MMGVISPWTLTDNEEAKFFDMFITIIKLVQLIITSSFGVWPTSYYSWSSFCIGLLAKWHSYLILKIDVRPHRPWGLSFGYLSLRFSLQRIMYSGAVLLLHQNFFSRQKMHPWETSSRLCFITWILYKKYITARAIDFL